MSGIDLVFLDDGTDNQYMLRYAPYNTVNIGDTVLVEEDGKSVFCTVVDKTYTFNQDDIFLFLNRNIEILPIKSVLRELKYKGENYDLST